ncbi:GNAT family N-acetyltransferase [Halobacteriales archaeon QS_3_64_16]|nr:MAG: GNAT family N-acetyltransferase [Halobacteriales archaeon QS_3_64_16]
MSVYPLPTDEAAVRRYVEELWVPYHGDLEATVEGHALADDVDPIEEEVEFRLDRLEGENYQTWIAVDDLHSDGSRDETALVHIEGEFAGFIATEIDRSPSVFDRLDRLLVSVLYVSEPCRGSVLAQDLVRHAVGQAREAGCVERTLNVDTDNERAVDFYGELGFVTYRCQMLASVDTL